jgi:hypothetical protein
VKITGSSTTGSDITVPTDSDIAVPDEDIPVQFTKVMGKGRVCKCESLVLSRL